MSKRKKKKEKRKLEVIVYYISQLSFSLCEIQENDIYFTGFKGATENIWFSPFKRSGHTLPAATGQVLVHSPVEEMFKAYE